MDIKRDLRQRDIDAFFPLIRGVSAADLSAPEYAGQVVRAAAKVGMIPGLAAESVDDMRPGEVVSLAAEINKAIAEALTIPPD